MQTVSIYRFESSHRREKFVFIFAGIPPGWIKHPPCPSCEEISITERYSASACRIGSQTQADKPAVRIIVDKMIDRNRQTDTITPDFFIFRFISLAVFSLSWLCTIACFKGISSSFFPRQRFKRTDRRDLKENSCRRQFSNSGNSDLSGVRI